VRQIQAPPRLELNVEIVRAFCSVSIICNACAIKLISIKENKAIARFPKFAAIAVPRDMNFGSKDAPTTLRILVPPFDLK